MEQEGPNVELLRSTLLWAEAEAEKPREESAWYQADWCVNVTDPHAEFYDNGTEYAKSPRCGTAYCIAGYATVASLSGDLRLDVENQRVVNISDPTYSEEVDDFATRVLGIDSAQADLLFDGNNTITRVREVMHDIVGHPL